MKSIGLIIASQFFCLLLQALPTAVFDGFPVPDTLRAKIYSAKDDRGKVDALNDVCYYLADKMPHRVLPIARKLVYWADSLQYPKGLFDATNNLGILFYRTSQYTQAIACFDGCLGIADQMSDVGRRAAVLSNMGLVYAELSQYQKAIDFHQQALRIREKRKDTLAIALTFNNLGMTYHARGDWNVALNYYQKAIRMLENTRYSYALANTFNNVGQLFFTCYHDTATWAADSAELYFMKAYTRFSADDNRIGVIKTLINLGNTYATSGNTEKAIDAYRAALNQQRQIADSAGIALTLFNMGTLFDETGDPKRAVNYLMESLKIAKAYNLSELCRDLYEQLFYLARRDNNYQLATLYAANFLSINDSLSELSKKMLIEQFQGKYNFQEIENEKLNAKTQQWKLIGQIAIGLVIFLGIGLVWLLIRQKK